MISTFKKSAAVALVAAALGAPSAHAQDAPELPSTMVWTSYDQGSAGFVEASAMADAFDKAFKTRIRIVPSGTAVGRLLPMKTGRANFGFLGNELHFASEAMFEFAAPEWGPQDVRAILGRPAQVGLVAGGDTDIETVADLKGRKIGYVEANPSTTLNTEAVLAFAGLTTADVDAVVYPGYGAMLQAFISGEIDVAPAIPTSSALREAEAGRGVRWLDLPASDTEGWDRVADFASIFSPDTATVGVSISEEDPAELLGYRYPLLSTYASVNEDDVYNLVKGLDQSYGLYKDASKVIGKWKISISGKAPSGAPFHPGAIRYLKEIDVWTDEDEAWNKKRIARADAVKAAWDEARAKAEADGVSDADWPAFWNTWRAENLK